MIGGLVTKMQGGLNGRQVIIIACYVRNSMETETDSWKPRLTKALEVMTFVVDFQVLQSTAFVGPRQLVWSSCSTFA